MIMMLGGASGSECWWLELTFVLRLRSGQVHIGIGLEGVGCSHKDLLALAIIQTMLGGGDSFSAGGPGKGLRSRIFLNILYNHGVLSSSALNVSYKDTGLFGINATTTPEHTSKTIELIVKVP